MPSSSWRGDSLAQTTGQAAPASRLSRRLVASIVHSQVAALTLALTAPAQCPLPVWQPVPGGGSNNFVAAMLELPNGDWIVGGSFTSIGGTAANCVARWNGSSWSPLGSGLANGWFFTSAYGLLQLANGDILATGVFAVAGGVSANAVARWNGTMWSAFGTPLGLGNNVIITDAVELPNGDVVVSLWRLAPAPAGALEGRVMRWNGAAWSTLGIGGTYCGQMLVLPNGDLVVGGQFASMNGVAANNIALWNGSAWLPLGAGTDAGVYALASLPNGDLVAGGAFQTAGGIPALRAARWDGTGWNAMGGGLQGTVSGLLPTSNGTLLACGYVTDGYVSRWDGTAWASLESGLALTGSTPTTVHMLLQLNNGDYLVGGTFTLAGGGSNLGRRSPCAPAVSSFAAGCPSSGGANTLTVLAPPLLDATVRTRGQGLPTTALIASVWGLTPIVPALPLASLFPSAPAGCSLQVTPDRVGLSLASSGTSESYLAVPATAALLGAVLAHQLVPFELDASGAIVAVTATNALRLTIGAD
jgi:hypothetical protein